MFFNSQSTTGNAMLHGNAHESVTLAFVKQANCICGPGMNVNGKGQMRVNALPRFGQPFFQWRRPQMSNASFLPKRDIMLNAPGKPKTWSPCMWLMKMPLSF